MTADIAGRLLVIDDEAGIRDGCRRVLEPEGYHLETAASGREGLQSIRDQAFDLVLLDVVMPDVRGIDILGQIQGVDPDIVCIIITGYATVELAVEAIRSGAYDFLAKPFTSEVLLMTVRQGLERRQLRQETRRLQAIEQQAAELVRAKRELERLDRFKSRFMLTVAHELRAPLSAIQSFLLALNEGYIHADQRQLILGRAIERGQELLDLVNDLLRIAAVKAEDGVNDRELVCLADVLERVSVLHGVQAAEKGLAYTMKIHHRPMVMANTNHMTHLWDNLISNAVRYTQPGGQVEVALEEQQGWAIGTVKDSGIGIAPEDQSVVFQEFFRTSEAKRLEPHGTGLGLSLVKSIVEIHGGSIEVDSAPGKGSLFTFRLPLAAVHPDSGPSGG